MEYLLCDECEFLIAANNANLHNYDHHETCSLYPDLTDWEPSEALFLRYRRRAVG